MQIYFIVFGFVKKKQPRLTMIKRGCCYDFTFFVVTVQLSLL
jgi:hypothetical protein